MQNLEVIEMTITAISHPFPSIVRIRGEINTTQPDLWTTPNLAIRLEVHQQADSLPYHVYIPCVALIQVPVKLKLTLFYMLTQVQQCFG